jgi:hypothetical protein
LDGLEVIRGGFICLALLRRIEGQLLKDLSVTREPLAGDTWPETSMDR